MAKKTHIKVRMVPESNLIANSFIMQKNPQREKKQKINLN